MGSLGRLITQADPDLSFSFLVALPNGDIAAAGILLVPNVDHPFLSDQNLMALVPDIVKLIIVESVLGASGSHLSLIGSLRPRSLRVGMPISPYPGAKEARKTCTLGGFLRDASGRTFGFTAGHAVFHRDPTGNQHRYEKIIQPSKLDWRNAFHEDDMPEAVPPDHICGTICFANPHVIAMQHGSPYLYDYAVFTAERRLKHAPNQANQASMVIPKLSISRTDVRLMALPLMHDIYLKRDPADVHVKVAKLGAVTWYTSGVAWARYPMVDTLKGQHVCLFVASSITAEDPTETALVFGGSGDSGSWIFDERGGVLGVISHTHPLVPELTMFFSMHGLLELDDFRGLRIL